MFNNSWTLIFHMFKHSEEAVVSQTHFKKDDDGTPTSLKNLMHKCGQFQKLQNK